MICFSYLCVFVISIPTCIIDFIYLFYLYSFPHNQTSNLHRTVLFWFTLVYTSCRSLRNTLNVLGWKAVMWTWYMLIGSQIGLSTWHALSVNATSQQFVLLYVIWFVCFICSLGIDFMFFRPDEEKRQLRLSIEMHFRTYRESEEEECFICGEQTSEFILLECSHQVHAACFARWCETWHSTCPLCRERVV